MTDDRAIRAAPSGLSCRQDNTRSGLSTGCHKTVTFANGPRYQLYMQHCFALTLAVALAAPAISQAQIGDLQCDDSTRMTHTLKNVIGAERQGMGLRDPDTMLEVWVAGSNGAWLIVQNYANGTSCIVAMGDHWQSDMTGPA